MRIFLIAVFMTISLTACAQQPVAEQNIPPASPPVAMEAPPPVVPVPQMPEPTACNPPAGLIGQSKKVLETMKFKGPVRIIGPNDMVTMDYSPERLNIVYDAKGIIREVKCG